MNFKTANVNVPLTGYDVPRTGNLSFDRRYNGQRVRGNSPDEESRPIVQMSIGGPGVAFDPAMRLPSGKRAKPELNPRYQNETVRFNLGMLARPKGSPVQ